MDRGGEREADETAASAATVTVDDRAGSALPPPRPHEGDRYRRGDEIARGGVGVVIAAVDRRLDREVALKELLAPTPMNRARFRREARITARLEHPGVVPIYDQAWSASGEPFYVMRRVAGRSLSEELAARPELGARLALLPTVLAVADTIAYAHGHRVIHRDLKPSNVLCGEHGTTLVIDWGLAKDLRARDGDEDDDAAVRVPVDPGLTSHGTVMGTPAYMAPEQARGKEADERADVYALGAILYQLLAGKAPYADAGSSTLDAVLAGPPPAVDERAPHAPRALVSIVQRAMHRDPAARYPTAADLAKDLRAFQSGGLVSTYRYGVGERLRRWIAQHRAAFTVAVVLGTALVALAAVSVRRIARERDRARAALHAVELRDRERALRHAEAQLDVDPTAAVAWLAQSRPTESEAWRSVSLAQSAAARGIARHVFALDGDGVLLVGDDRAALATDGAGAVWTWDGARLRRVATGAAEARAFVVRGDRAIWGARDGIVRETALSSGATRTIDRGGWVRGAAVAADGAVWWVDADGVIRRVHRGSAEEVARTDGPTAELAVDGERWAVGHENGIVVTGVRAGGPPRREQVHDREVGFLVFVGDELVTAAEEGRVHAWNLATDTRRELGRHEDWIAALSVSPDRRTVATASADRTIGLWPLDDRPARRFAGHARPVTTLAWASTGVLATADSAGVIRIWGDHGHAWASMPAGGRVRRLVWRGTELVGLVGPTLRVWPQQPAVARHFAAEVGDATALAVSDDGGYIAIGGRDQRVAAWRTHDGALLVDREVGSPVGALALVAPRRLTIGSNRSSEHWELTEPAELVAVRRTHSGTEAPLVFADGDRVAWIDHTLGGALLSGEDGLRRVAPGTQPDALALPSDERELLVAERGGALTSWPLDGGAPRDVASLTGRARHLEVSPSRRWLLSGAASAAVVVWPLAGGPARELDGTRGATSWTTITVDDHAVVGVRGELVITPLGGGEPVRWRGHRADIIGTAASRDGAILASADRDGEVRAWRRRDGASVVVGDWAPGALLAFTTDGQLAVASGATVHLLPPPRFEDAPAEPDRLTTATLDRELRPRTPVDR